jgi:hypothetical protein
VVMANEAWALSGTGDRLGALPQGTAQTARGAAFRSYVAATSPFRTSSEDRR